MEGTVSAYTVYMVAQRHIITTVHHQFTANKGVIWHFTPPLAPYIDGTHETIIKPATTVSQAVLGNADINDQELTTVMIGAEGLLNSWTLT